MIALISTLLGIVMLFAKLYVDTKNAHDKEKNDAANEISNALASGDVSAVNSAIGKLRR